MRKMSEGIETLALSNFALSQDALVEEDRLHNVPAGGTATVFSEVANISKNLIGGGVLSLSGGMALYANDPRASLSAGFLVCLLGAVFGYFCLL